MQGIHVSSATLSRAVGSTSVPDLRLGSLAQSTSWSIVEQLKFETDAQREAFVGVLTKWSTLGRTHSTETFSPMSHGTTAARLGGVVELLDEAIAMYKVHEDVDLDEVVGMPFPATVPASWVAEVSRIEIVQSADDIMDWYDSQPPA